MARREEPLLALPGAQAHAQIRAQREALVATGKLLEESDPAGAVAVAGLLAALEVGGLGVGRFWALGDVASGALTVNCMPQTVTWSSVQRCALVCLACFAYSMQGSRGTRQRKQRNHLLPGHSQGNHTPRRLANVVSVASWGISRQTLTPY